MSVELNLKQTKSEWHGSLKAYVIGCIGSLLLTGISFFLVFTKPFSNQTIVYTIVTLALLQAVVQLLFFLHVGQEPKPRWETLIFYFMMLILLIVVIGSLWIMSDLNDRVMSDMTKEMKHD